jgi:hypothetical protein
MVWLLAMVAPFSIGTVAMHNTHAPAVNLPIARRASGHWTPGADHMQRYPDWKFVSVFHGLLVEWQHAWLNVDLAHSRWCAWFCSFYRLVLEHVLIIIIIIGWVRGWARFGIRCISNHWGCVSGAADIPYVTNRVFCWIVLGQWVPAQFRPEHSVVIKWSPSNYDVTCEMYNMGLLYTLQ